MKILKNLAVLAVASALILAGCQNNFTGTTLDTSSLTAANRSAMTWTSAPSTVSTVANATNQIITINFQDAVDTSSIESAVTIRTLSDASDAKTPYTQGSTISYTLGAVNGNSVDLVADFSSVTTDLLEVFIDSTKLTARNGSAKLNLDGDQVTGETGDDDVYLYPSVTGTGVTALTTGTKRSPRLGFPITITFNTPSTTTDNTLTATYAYAVLGDTTDYLSLLSGNISVEKFNTSSNAWETVASTTTPTYSTTTGVYTFTFAAAAAGTVYRYKIDASKFVTTNQLAGYVQHLRFSGIAGTLYMDGTPTIYGANTPVADPLNVPGTIFTGHTIIKDASGKNAYIELTYSVTTGSLIGDQGFNTSTFTASNVKLYDTSKNVFLTISSISFVPVATDVTPNKVRIYLDPAFKPANNIDVYMGTGVLTLGDKTPGTKAGYMGDPSNIQDLPYGIGFANEVTATF